MKVRLATYIFALTFLSTSVLVTRSSSPSHVVTADRSSVIALVVPSIIALPPSLPVVTTTEPPATTTTSAPPRAARTPTKSIQARPIVPESNGPWQISQATWYGPGLYGNNMYCGGTLTTETVGVANKTLACGTLVTLSYEGAEITVPVVDRGPFVKGVEFDITYGACRQINHCFSGSITWKT